MFPLTTTGEGNYANGRGEEVAVKGREGTKGGRVEGWKEGRRRWKEMEPGEEKAKRMQTHISWKDCRYLATGPLFLAAAGIYFSANYFFLLASGFLFFFGARVRVE